MSSRGRKVVLVSVLAAALLGAGCGSSRPSSSGSPGDATPAAATPGSPGTPSAAAAAPGSTGASETADLGQAQQAVKDLQAELGRADSALGANPSTEGDVNP